MTIAINLSTVRSDTSPTNGIRLDTVNGALNIGTTILNNGVGTPILIQDTPSPLIARFGNTSIHSTIGATQAQNVDTTTGNGDNLTISFTTLSIVFP